MIQISDFAKAFPNNTHLKQHGTILGEDRISCYIPTTNILNGSIHIHKDTLWFEKHGRQEQISLGRYAGFTKYRSGLQPNRIKNQIPIDSFLWRCNDNNISMLQDVFKCAEKENCNIQSDVLSKYPRNCYTLQSEYKSWKKEALLNT